MNNYKITFSDLKRISESFTVGYDDIFIEYLNSFRGKDIYEKFKTILKAWDNDVSYTLNFNIKDTPTKIQLSYINSQFQELSEDVYITEGNVKIIIGIPTQFEFTETIPIYNILKYIDISGISINLTDLSFHDKRAIIDKLPGNVFNIILKNIEKEKEKTFKVDNPMLENFKINFLSADPLTFLKGLFSNFDEYYFRDVIFVLSKRIDGNILLQSTPLEIEYYVEKMSNDAPDNDAMHI